MNNATHQELADRPVCRLLKALVLASMGFGVQPVWASADPGSPPIRGLNTSAPSDFSLEVEWPKRRLWVGAAGVEGIRVRVVDPSGETVDSEGVLTLTGLSAQGEIRLVNGEVTLPPTRIDAPTVRVEVGALERAFGVPITSGWWSLIPAMVAIGLALATRQVIVALLGGVFVGALILGFGVVGGFGNTLDRLVYSAAELDHVKIMMFTLLMGGLVGLVTSSGGAAGILRWLVCFARTPRSALLSTWAMGMAVFFDDYASSLLVGNTMRPVTDDLKVSREKLAYIVDSTAAPIASLALISTWIGYEISVLADAMKLAGIERDAYEVFIAGLPSRFYQILCLVFVAYVAATGRDFGPMLSAERRARQGRGLLRPGAKPLMDTKMVSDTGTNARPRLWLALLPIGTMIGVALGVMAITGLSGAAADPEVFAAARGDGIIRTLGFVLGNAASYDALVYGAGAGVGVAIIGAGASRALRWSEAFDAFLRGIQAMMLAVVVLVLAWSVGSVMGDLHAGAFVSSAIGDRLPLAVVPALAFVLAALIASATGSSWGTMAVLFPIVIPLAASGLGSPNGESIFLAASSAVLGGAVFGDHISPISDTTVLSSIACASDHVDHTRTQAPYALVVGAVAIVLGYLPVGFGFSPWLLLILGAGLLFAGLWFWGRPSDGPSIAQGVPADPIDVASTEVSAEL